jgi:hypothetical protein
MGLLQRLSWPALVAVGCVLAAVLVGVIWPDRGVLGIALSGGGVTFAILSVRDLITTNTNRTSQET